MLVSIGLLMLFGMTSALMYNRLAMDHNATELFRREVETSWTKLQEAYSTYSGKSAEDLSYQTMADQVIINPGEPENPVLKPDVPNDLAKYLSDYQYYLIQLNNIKTDYHRRYNQIPYSIIARIGGFKRFE
ncbi:MAG: hypothetical protein ACI959_001022 [Limisphaerales bacterium]|jgi:hypothetical protein